MSKQLIICMECDKASKTDWFYIKSVIDERFTYGNDVKISPIYMGGKTNYKTSKVVSQIKKLVKAYTGSSQVIVCVDTDNIASEKARSDELKRIMDYCEEKGYEFVWFSLDVEDVFLGHSVHNSDKKSEAMRFRRTNAIKSFDIERLGSTHISRNKSNLLIVLQKHLEYKN